MHGRTSITPSDNYYHPITQFINTYVASKTIQITIALKALPNAMRNGYSQEEETSMNTEIIQTPLRSHQIRFDWLSAARLKRGALLYWAALFTLSAAIINFISVLKQPPQAGFLAVLLFGGACIQAMVAVFVVALSARRPFIAAAVIEGAATLLWIVAHTSGFPIGPMWWRAETISTLDLYIPIMEGLSA